MANLFMPNRGDNPRGITGDQHIPLLYNIQLLPELKLACSRVYYENLLKVAPSFFRLGVEYLTIRHIAPLSDVIFFDQQYPLKVEKGGRILPCENGLFGRAESWC